MRNHEKLSSLGAVDDYLIMVVSSSAPLSSSSQNDDRRVDPYGTAVNPAAFQPHFQSDSNFRAQIFQILQHVQPKKKIKGSTTALNHIQNLYTQDAQLPDKKMMVIIIDELDYLITRDCEVLHELFMLTILPSSRFILIDQASISLTRHKVHEKSISRT